MIYSYVNSCYLSNDVRRTERENIKGYYSQNCVKSYFLKITILSLSSLRSGLGRFEISHMIIPTRSLKINYWLYWSILSFSERFKAKAIMKSFACLIYFAAGFSGPCAQHNDYIKRNFSPKNMANIFVPKVQDFNNEQSIYTDILILEKCSSDGYYAEVQCRYGYCQCMQRDGQYIQVDLI